MQENSVDFSEISDVFSIFREICLEIASFGKVRFSDERKGKREKGDIMSKPDLTKVIQILEKGEDFVLTDKQYLKYTNADIPKNEYYTKKNSAVAKCAHEYGYVVDVVPKKLVFKKQNQSGAKMIFKQNSLRVENALRVLDEKEFEQCSGWILDDPEGFWIHTKNHLLGRTVFQSKDVNWFIDTCAPWISNLNNENTEKIISAVNKFRKTLVDEE